MRFPSEIGRGGRLALPSLVGLLCLSSCNLIWDIQEGELTGGGGAGGTTTGGTGGTGGSGGTGASGGTGGTGGTGATGGGGTGGTGNGGPCSGLPAADGQDTLWVKQGVGNYVDEGLAIALQPDGGVMIAGTYQADGFTVGAPTEDLPYPAGGPPGEQRNVFVARYADDGKPTWALGFQGPDEQKALSMATDPAGDAIVGGYLVGSMLVGATTLTSDAMYSDIAMDGFVVKVSASGAVSWVKELGGISTEQVTGVATDSQGNVVVLGVALLGGDLNPQSPPATAEADFGCGPRTLEKDKGIVFVTKLAPDGGCLWDRQIELHTHFYGLYNPPQGLALAIDKDDNVLVSGGLTGITDFGNGFILVDEGYKDIFVAKLDPTGDTLWAKTFGDRNFQIASVMTTDPQGDIWIGGNFQYSVTLDPLEPQTDPLADTGYWKMFIAKLEIDADPVVPATPVFLRAMSDVGYQFVTSAGTTPEGDVVFGGILFDGEGSEGIDFGDGDKAPPPGPGEDLAYHEDGFVAKYCASGGLRWAKRLGTSEIEEVHGVAVDTGGHTFVTGLFAGKYAFGGSQSLTSVSFDAFTLKIGPR